MTTNYNYPIKYCGVFFDYDEVQNLAQRFEAPLYKIIEKPHVTLKYRPSEDDVESLKAHLGERVKFTAQFWGNNEKNSGFAVSLSSLPSKEIYERLQGIKFPHITTSIAEGAKAVDTYKLFDGSGEPPKLIAPESIRGRVGFFLENGDVVFD